MHLSLLLMLLAAAESPDAGMDEAILVAAHLPHQDAGELTPVVLSQQWQPDRDEQELVALVRHPTAEADGACFACALAPLDLLLLKPGENGFQVIASAAGFAGAGPGHQFVVAPKPLALDGQTQLISVESSYLHHGNGASGIQLFRRQGAHLRRVFQRFWAGDTRCGDSPPETDSTFEFCSASFTVRRRSQRPPELVEEQTCVTHACRDEPEYSPGDTVTRGKKTRSVYRWNGTGFTYTGGKPPAQTGFQY